MNPDVVVVGSGVAGSILADRLAQSGVKVLILESGQRIKRDDAVKRYRHSLNRNLHAPYQRQAHASFPNADETDPYLTVKGDTSYWVNYLRVAGGSTWHWGGMTPRFLPVDFKLRENYGVGQDWPITYQDIESYYLQAEQELGVSGDSDDDHGSPRSGAYPMPATKMLYADQVIAGHLEKHNIKVKVLPKAINSQPYRGRSECCGSNSCIPICPTGAKYSADIHLDSAIKNGAEFVENAAVTSLNISRDGKVDSLSYKTPDGQSHNIQCRYVVLACNGIETPKLLLISQSESTPNGVANSSGMVGRRLMDHPILDIKFLTSEPIYGSRGPQMVSKIDYGQDGKFRSKHAAGWCSLLMSSPDIHSFVNKIIEVEKDWSLINQRINHFMNHFGSINILLEQLPDKNNFIKPSSSDFDKIGIPKPEIHMNYDSYIKSSINHFNNFTDKILNHINAKSINDNDADRFNLLGAGHPMGTTCMGVDPEHSVVDKNCRTHDHPNLFIAGSSVFPTGSCVPPTLTISALSLRLADYLKSII